jgi:recombination protein RecA
LMGNPGNGHAEWKEKSGQSIGYQGDVKLRAKYHTSWSLTQDGSPVGQEVHWTAQWSALGAPGGEATSYIRYGQGIDIYKENIDLGTNLGLIDKGGAWYTMSFLGDEKTKFQGAEKTRNYLIENSEAFEKLNTEIRKMLGFIK